jgi:large subunit ribosomal protein L31
MLALSPKDWFNARPHWENFMKIDTHPEYLETTITCACGAVYTTRSTRQDIRIGICAACHPFYTGQQKFVDTAGRVDKFKRRFGTVKASEALAAAKKKK